MSKWALEIIGVSLQFNQKLTCTILVCLNINSKNEREGTDVIFPIIPALKSIVNLKYILVDIIL